MSERVVLSDTRRQAGWLPDQADLEAWLDGHRKRTHEHRTDGEVAPVIEEFRDLLDHEPVLRMYLERAIAETPVGRSYANRPFDSVDELLLMIDEVLTLAPEFGDEMAATPLGAVLDWTMGTTAGFAAYRDPRLNAMLRKVLTEWCRFLDSEQSLYVLNDGPRGWLSDEARRTLGLDEYEQDPDDPHLGFSSWNDFFTRRFKPGARPVAAPDDDSVIVNACESTPYRIVPGVQRTDRFWIKSQPYSLAEMLADDEAVDRFVGGTVYQAFLSANDYHRWHSPVSGTVLRASVLEGTYYAESEAIGADATEPIDSQAYITHIAARALMIIQADDPAIGLVAFLAVGMVEVSTCIIAEGARAGMHLSKGDELGRFQFGGSTHCVIFEPGVIQTFEADALPRAESPNPPLKQVRTALAHVGRPARDR